MSCGVAHLAVRGNAASGSTQQGQAAQAGAARAGALGQQQLGVDGGRPVRESRPLDVFEATAAGRSCTAAEARRGWTQGT